MTWTVCAGSGDNCVIPTGVTADVRFGHASGTPGFWTVHNKTGTVGCGEYATDFVGMGDPAPGYSKYCEYQEVAAEPPTGGASGSEGSGTTNVTCSVSPCAINLAHTWTAAKPTATTQDYEDMGALGALILFAVVVAWCLRGMRKIFEVNPNEKD